MNKIPRHLGIIMDGNRRWAKARGLPAFQGYAAGLRALKKIIRHCRKRGVKTLTVFALSTENWQRSDGGAGFLMAFCQKAINRGVNDLAREGVKVRVIGEMHAPPRRIPENNGDMVLNIALSYGGRAEIVAAVKNIVQKEIPAEKITEATIAQNLWAPDLDFLIRTGKEQRISNFLIWQAAYAELYFSEKLWPEFTEEDLDKALDEFATRERRHGK